MDNWQFTPYAFLYTASVLTAIGLSIFAWGTRSVRGSRYFSLLTLSTGIWAFGHLIGFFHRNTLIKILMIRVEYLGIITTSMFWLLFVASYTQFDQWVNKKSIAGLSIIPIVSYVLILTFPWHNWFYLDYEFVVQEGLLLFRKTYGAGFYLWTSYAYIIVMTGVLILIRGMLRMPRKYRWQIIPLTLVIILILTPNALYISNSNPIAPYDPTPLSFVLTGAIFFILMKLYHFLDVVPVAYHLFFKHVQSGVIITDERKHILDMNLAAESYSGARSSFALGKNIFNLFPDHQTSIQKIIDSPGTIVELQIHPGRWYELQSTNIQKGQEAIEGHIIMFYDISDRKMAEDELRKQANTDSLTGALNRRHLFGQAERLFQQSKRYQHDLTVLMIDLDHFKHINDRHGHTIGDQVLIELVQRLQKKIRLPDILGRYGGEEFVILMPETPPESARNAGERLRKAVDKTPIQTEIGPVKLTISVGIATSNFETDTTIDQLIDRADQALYQAKQAGRNRVSAK
ncbi:MAG: diguanylate cyclase [Chloroflexi bacterium]|nr:diguanylate cyclase [Chloroflexota bacterium]